MPLPLIAANMYFDTVLKALEQVLKNESANQITLGGTGWETVRERFDPWCLADTPQIVNVSYNTSGFEPSQVNAFDQTNDANYSIDCYALANAIESGGAIIPKDQQAADVLHALISKIYFTIMSPINRDLGLTPGNIETPIVLRIEKFIPTESNIPINGVIAARLSVKITFKENPPLQSGVSLEVVGVDTDTADGGLVEQEFNTI